MNSIYQEKFQITAAHTNCMGLTRHASLLYFAQEAAGGHCRELALDWDTLAKRGLFWAVIRYRMQITRLPKIGETITVETWPMPTTRSAFPRATVAYDEAGKELFRTLGLWVLMDRENRTMLLPGKSGIDLPGTVRGLEIETPGSLMPVKEGSAMTRTVRFSELDRNGHMNNTYYMNWVDDLLPAEFHRQHPAKEILLCYLSEAREGQEITLDWKVEEGGILQVDGHRSETDVPHKQTRVFAAKVLF